MPEVTGGPNPNPNFDKTSFFTKGVVGLRGDLDGGGQAKINNLTSEVKKAAEDGVMTKDEFRNIAKAVGVDLPKDFKISDLPGLGPKGKEAIKEIVEKTGNENITFMSLDLASFDSIRNFVKELENSDQKIDLLINNAGLAYSEIPLTKEGFNMVFGVNFIGTALLTLLLVPHITRGGRIVNISSEGAFLGAASISIEKKIKVFRY